MIRPLPCCGYKGNAATIIKLGSTHVFPKKGDVSICANCGCWHLFIDNEHGTRPFTVDDLDAIDDADLKAMRHVTRLIKRRGRLEK